MNLRCGRRTASGFALACASAALWLGTGTAAADNTIVVNTTQTSPSQGDGLCSLGEAVLYADGVSEPDCSAAPRSGTTTIKLPPGRYTPIPFELVNPTTIDGAGGASSTEISPDSQHPDTVIQIASTATVTLSNLEISGGLTGLVPGSGGCTGNGSSLVCPDGETGLDGGGIVNLGTLTVQNVLVTGNHASDGTGPIGVVLHICSACDGGNGANGGNGGGIYNGASATLSINDSTITANGSGAGGAGSGGSGNGGSGGNGGSAGLGGGIYNLGTLEITNSTISDNTTGAGGRGGDGAPGLASGDDGGDSGNGGYGGDAAGIYSTGNTTIAGSTISGNAAGAGAPAGTPGASGGGSGTAGFSGSYAGGGPGGGLELDLPSGVSAQLTDDTIAGNAAGPATHTQQSTPGVAGGIAYMGPGALALDAVTIADNSSYLGGAIYVVPISKPTEKNSIIADNTATAAAPNCGGYGMIDDGHNVTFGEPPGQATCPGTVADPKLQALAGNGGPTQTMRLGAGSAAIGAVPTGGCDTSSDQRGIPRSSGAACDAGAYEVAPPRLSATQVTANGPTTASVGGQVAANLTDTKVTVLYGTTTSYGSTSAGTDAGSSLIASPFSISLTGLTPSTTYHAQIVATNLDGTTTTSDTTFATPAVIAVSVSAMKIVGDAVLVQLSCTQGGPSCSGGLKLTSRITTKHGKVVAISAAASSKKSKRLTVQRKVGSGSYSLVSGQTKVIKLTLNHTGKTLLRARHRLPTLLTSSGPAHLSEKVTFIYKRSRNKKL